MLKELKPFMHIVSKLYVKYGYKDYPLCRYEQERIDVKEVANYINAHIMQLSTNNR
jgi:hypothetical protein